MLRFNETDLLFSANLSLLREARDLDVRLDAEQAPDGLLELREGICLYLLARRAARFGNVIEIGSFKGRSTWFLARGLEDADSPHRVVAIDPHLEGTDDAFRLEIERTGITSRVDVRRAYSHEVAPSFDEPIGLVWIDGDHAYDGVRRDFEDWFPRLAEGGWIAFHDTVNQWYGPTRLVRELLSTRDDLNGVGVMGIVTFARKVDARPVNRLRVAGARVGFEIVAQLRGHRTGRGPLNVAPNDR